MIIAKLKWNTPLYKVDEFVTKFRDRYKNKQVRIDVKLTDTECLIYLFKKFNWWKIRINNSTKKSIYFLIDIIFYK